MKFIGLGLASASSMRLISLLLVFFQIPLAFAKVQLLSWSPSPSHPSMIIPQVDGESPAVAVVRYHQSLKAQPELMKSFPDGNFPFGKVQPFFSAPDRPTVGIIANEPADLGAHTERVKRFIKIFRAHGSDPYVLPLASDLRLNEKDRADYFSLLAESVSLVLGMGGRDITPAVFGQENRFSVGTNLTRDRAESRLWRGLLSSSVRPYIVAICRSHQFLLSLFGFQLVQDIESELHLPSHRNGQHVLEILDSRGFETLYSSLPHQTSNTLHHQGFIQVPQNGPVKVTARAVDGIIEATVFKDSSGATFQFHPELMSPEVFEAFVRDSLEQARLHRERTFSKIRFFTRRNEPTRNCRAVFY